MLWGCCGPQRFCSGKVGLGGSALHMDAFDCAKALSEVFSNIIEFAVP